MSRRAAAGFYLPKAEALVALAVRGVIIGKILRLGGASFFYRGYGEDVARFRKDDSLSFDALALPELKRWRVNAIHFDGGQGVVYIIALDDFEREARHGNYGQGDQLYVGLEHWRQVTLFYQPGWTNNVQQLAPGATAAGPDSTAASQTAPVKPAAAPPFQQGALL